MQERQVDLSVGTPSPYLHALQSWIAVRAGYLRKWGILQHHNGELGWIEYNQLSELMIVVYLGLPGLCHHNRQLNKFPSIYRTPGRLISPFYQTLPFRITAIYWYAWSFFVASLVEARSKDSATAMRPSSTVSDEQKPFCNAFPRHSPVARPFSCDMWVTSHLTNHQWSSWSISAKYVSTISKAKDSFAAHYPDTSGVRRPNFCVL